MIRAIFLLSVFSFFSSALAMECVSTVNKILSERGLEKSTPKKSRLPFANETRRERCRRLPEVGAEVEEIRICGQQVQEYVFAPDDILVDELLSYDSSENFVRVYRLTGNLREIQTQDGLTFRFDSKCNVESVGDGKVLYYETINPKICAEINLPLWESRKGSLPNNFSDLEKKYNQERMPEGLEKEILEYDKLLHPAKTYEGQLWALSKRLGGRIQPTKHGFESAQAKCKQYFPESRSGVTSRSSGGKP